MHKHWKFFAWNGDQLTTKFVVDISVVGHETEDEALKEAMRILTREHYELRQVWECTTCEFQKRYLNSVDGMTEAMKS